MTWRAAKHSDYRNIATLMLALYEEDPAPTPMTLEKAERSLRRLEAEPTRGCAVVYETSDGIGGYALLCSFWSNELGGEACIVDELYVAPKERGGGVATSFIQGLAERRLPWFTDAVAIELEVTPNNARARALYERLGFKAYKNSPMRLGA